MLQEHFSPILKDGGLENLWLAAESGYLYKTGTSNHHSAGPSAIG